MPPRDYPQLALPRMRELTVFEEQLLSTGKHLLIATDVLRLQGQHKPNSRHPEYAKALRLLHRLEREGYLASRHFPQSGLTVFWVIP